MRIYRQPTTNSPRRRIALGTVAATAGIAFLIAVIALTAGDLVSGGSIGKGGGRTTLLGGHRKNQQEQKQDATTEKTTPDQTGTRTDQAPTTDTAPAAPPPSDTAPVTPPSDPTQTAPAPEAVP